MIIVMKRSSSNSSDNNLKTIRISFSTLQQHLGIEDDNSDEA